MAIDAEVCVLGAGLAGATAALELARRGRDVLLLDQDPLPFNRASLRNEGKVHLGFVYAKDDRMATPSLMLDGALTFRRLLQPLLAGRWEALTTSTPFLYLVARDSLLPPEALQRRYAKIERLYREKLHSFPDRDYLGGRPERLFERIELRNLSYCDPASFIGAFRTEEVAIDTFQLADAFRAAILASPRIRFMADSRVAAVERLARGFRITGEGARGPWGIQARQVINALWEGRLRIDATVGIGPPAGWVHRLKYRVIARLPERLRAGPSVTMVLGPYGDVVVRPNGTAYLSWYPVGLRGWTHALTPPADWGVACKGEAHSEAAPIAAAILSAIDRWYPGVATSEPMLVDAGAIVAYGVSDVDDPESSLHNRTRVGVTSVDGYHSVDPGKLTTAPLFAVQAVRRVLGLGVPA